MSERSDRFESSHNKNVSVSNYAWHKWKKNDSLSREMDVINKETEDIKKDQLSELKIWSSK